MNVTEAVWQTLLALREETKSLPGDPAGVLVGKDTIVFVDTLEELKQKCCDTIDAVVSTQPLQLPGFITYSILTNGLQVHCRASLDESLHQIFRLYLPICTAALHSPNKTFSLIHAAQSLDGKFCTDNGSSKWIGNEQNLVHAHRIRALVDGVLVGGNTVRNDNPRLTVRHVKGPNPVRLFLCNALTADNEMTLRDSSPTLLLCSKLNEQCMRNRYDHYDNVRTVSYQTDASELKTPQLFDSLFGLGIRSLMIEGGPMTISTLMQANKVDWLQLHIAPMIFGSGKSLVATDEITSVSQANHLKGVFFTPMGNEMMVTGEP